ncbi:MAG: CapA family protein [Bacteroidota bacterium]
MRTRFPLWLGGLAVVCCMMLHGQGSIASQRLKLLAFGDVNLGRVVGKELLKGDLDYPFRFVKDTLLQADVVFINLESPLTDQGGETQHPGDNLVFCGPPEGAEALRRAGVTVASTGNNHAYDYRMRALEETLENLQTMGIVSAGTARDSMSLFPPAIVEKNGIRIAFLAYTQFVNVPGPWRGKISLFEEKRARRELAEARKISDIVVASLHGGVEYADRPPPETLAQFRFLIDEGADLVLGHHPHVPQGVERYRSKYIFYSLGNFVFSQPQLEWTQRSYGLEVGVRKDPSGTSIEWIRLLPLRAAKQPFFLNDSVQQLEIIEKIQSLSNVEIREERDGYFVQLQQR